MLSQDLWIGTGNPVTYFCKDQILLAGLALRCLFTIKYCDGQVSHKMIVSQSQAVVVVKF